MQGEWYGDELSHGRSDDVSPKTGPWPRRWLAATAAVVLAAAVIGWQAGRGSDKAAPPAYTSASPTSRAPTPAAAVMTTSPAPVPTEFQGATVSLYDAEMALGGRDPAVVNLSSAARTPISGLPREPDIPQIVRVDGGLVMLVLHGKAADQGPLASVYQLRDGSTRAHRLPGKGFALWPSSSGASFLVTGPGVGSRPTVEERDLSGRLLRRFVMRRRWFPHRGVTGGLLVTAHDALGAPSSLLVWSQDSNRTLRDIRDVEGVVSATTTHVMWTPNDGCVSESGDCSVHVTDLRDGSDVRISLAPHSFIASGALSPDGSRLALMLVGVDQREVAAYRFRVSDGVARPIHGATLAAANQVGMQWTADDTLILSSSTVSGTIFAVGESTGIGVLPVRAPPDTPYAVRPAH